MKINNVEKREKQLVGRLNQVLANLYLFPGYVLAVSTGVTELLSSDPQICGLLVLVMLEIFCFLAALISAVMFGYRQLGRLLVKKNELAVQIYRNYMKLPTASLN